MCLPANAAGEDAECSRPARQRLAGARNSFGGAVLAAALALWSPVLGAQEVTPAERERLEAAFERVLSNPTDLDLTYEYAQLATEYGDYEAAITAYERLLLFNPDLPRVKAELGVLYFRLGSLPTARAYLEQALAEGDPPPAARERIEGFLARIEQSERRHLFAGSASAGLRYQSNANYGPEGTILVFDIPAIPDDATAEEDDVNAFVSATGRYVYDFGNDQGDFFQAEATYYGSRQFQVSELDVDHLRLEAGPGYRFFPTESGPVLLRPTARVTYVRLDEESYAVSGGGGLEATWQALEDTGVFFNGFFEWRDYSATDERPNAEDQDGDAFRGVAGVVHQLTPSLSLRGEALAGHVDAQDLSEAYTEWGAGASLGASLPSPLAEAGAAFRYAARPWSLTVSARYVRREHEAANPIVSARVRADDDYRLDGTLAAPVWENWSVFATLGYQNNRSNIPNNEFENVSAAVGANVRF